MVAFNELSSHLLQEYSSDDTRRIKEIADKHNAAWNSINSRCTSWAFTLYPHICVRVYLYIYSIYTYIDTYMYVYRCIIH